MGPSAAAGSTCSVSPDSPALVVQWFPRLRCQFPERLIIFFPYYHWDQPSFLPAGNPGTRQRPEDLVQESARTHPTRGFQAGPEFTCTFLLRTSETGGK
ncbi:unnamed protein product [Protopolystoma xenopodis]|uniref:Uncharacterized protein n=1 Tax=Protopolystoma xenopodis TaxID=117903 RepID=A0A448XDE4_9PLAT|nr:unnamed protein product [Protopolystoma xenopodis]